MTSVADSTTQVIYDALIVPLYLIIARQKMCQRTCSGGFETKVVHLFLSLFSVSCAVPMTRKLLQSVTRAILLVPVSEMRKVFLDLRDDKIMG